MSRPKLSKEEKFKKKMIPFTVEKMMQTNRQYGNLEGQNRILKEILFKVLEIDKSEEPL